LITGRGIQRREARMPALEHCPNCGADLSRDAQVCPDCGSDERTGWSERAATQQLDLPDEEFDYDDFARREFGAEGKLKQRGVSWLWRMMALLLAGVMGWMLLHR
jgi:ribosomal protein L32